MTNTKKTYEEGEDAFENFKSLAQRLIVIPKAELDKKLKEEEHKRRPTKKRRHARASKKKNLKN